MDDTQVPCVATSCRQHEDQAWLLPVGMGTGGVRVNSSMEGLGLYIQHAVSAELHVVILWVAVLWVTDDQFVK